MGCRVYGMVCSGENLQHYFGMYMMHSKHKYDYLSTWLYNSTEESPFNWCDVRYVLWLDAT